MRIHELDPSGGQASLRRIHLGFGKSLGNGDLDGIFVAVQLSSIEKALPVIRCQRVVPCSHKLAQGGCLTFERPTVQHPYSEHAYVLSGSGMEHSHGLFW